MESSDSSASESPVRRAIVKKNSTDKLLARKPSNGIKKKPKKVRGIALYIPPHLKKHSKPSSSVPKAPSPIQAPVTSGTVETSVTQAQEACSAVVLNMISMYMSAQHEIKNQSSEVRTIANFTAENIPPPKTPNVHISDKKWTKDMQDMLQEKMLNKVNYLKTGREEYIDNYKEIKAKLRKVVRKARSKKNYSNWKKVFNYPDSPSNSSTHDFRFHHVDNENDYDASRSISISQRQMAIEEWTEFIDSKTTDVVCQIDEDAVSCSSGSTSPTSNHGVKSELGPRSSLFPSTAPVSYSNNEYQHQQLLRKQHDSERAQQRNRGMTKKWHVQSEPFNEPETFAPPSKFLMRDESPENALKYKTFDEILALQMAPQDPVDPDDDFPRYKDPKPIERATPPPLPPFEGGSKKRPASRLSPYSERQLKKQRVGPNADERVEEQPWRDYRAVHADVEQTYQSNNWVDREPNRYRRDENQRMYNNYVDNNPVPMHDHVYRSNWGVEGRDPISMPDFHHLPTVPDRHVRDHAVDSAVSDRHGRDNVPSSVNRDREVGLNRGRDPKVDHHSERERHPKHAPVSRKDNRKRPSSPQRIKSTVIVVENNKKSSDARKSRINEERPRTNNIENKSERTIKMIKSKVSEIKRPSKKDYEEYMRKRDLKIEAKSAEHKSRRRETKHSRR